MALRQRAEAIGRYLEAPARCQHCHGVIPIRAHRRPSEAKRKKYCNHSCAASANNRAFPKREPRPRFCKRCGSQVFLKARGYRRHCETCRAEIVAAGLSRKTVAEVKRAVLYEHARSVMRSEPKQCEACGYSKHVDVCHVRAVRLFPPETRLAVVNARSNLRHLCKNCHWELDHEESLAASLPPLRVAA